MIADFNLSRKALIFKAMKNKQIVDEKVSVVKSLFKMKKVHTKKGRPFACPSLEILIFN